MKNWLRGRKYFDWLPIITPVITFVFGLIGSKLLEARINPLFDTATRAMLTGLFFTSLMAVILLIIVTSFASRAEKREKTWIQTIGTPAELVFERIDIAKGKYYHILADFIEQASVGDEILIMSQIQIQ